MLCSIGFFGGSSSGGRTINSGERERITMVRNVSERTALKEVQSIIKTSSTGSGVSNMSAFHNLSGDLIFFKNENLAYLYANEHFINTFKLNPEKIIGWSDYDIFSAETAERMRNNDLIALSGNGTVISEIWIDEMLYQLSVSRVTEPGGGTMLGGVIRKTYPGNGFNEHKVFNDAHLTSLLEIAIYQSKSLEDFMAFALEKALHLSQSLIGFIFHYDEQNHEFTLRAWSKNVLNGCGVNGNRVAYCLEETGLLGEAVRQKRSILVNDYNAYAGRKSGLPDGHIPINRFLAAPVIINDKIVGMIGVANKERDYEEYDRKALELFANAIWKIVIHKEEERENLRAKVRAEELSAMKFHFFANMSHELRTPLVGILGFADILCTSIKDKELQQMAETIHSSGSRLLETLNLILTISKIEAAQFIPSIMTMNVIPVIRESVRLFEKSAIKKSISLNYISDTEQIIASTDQRMLRDTLNNLINNAIKFTQQGGVTVSVQQFDHHFSVSVSDTGIGIPVHKQKDIFDAFQQVGNQSDRNFEGTGLGLTITRRSVEQLNGSISLESEEGVGSVFTIEFPLENEPKARSKQLKQKVHLPEVPKVSESILHSILLVEDDVVNASIISLYLKGEYDSLWVNSGKKAIQAASTRQFDIILLDINLGKNLTGLDVAREIRKMPSYRTTPMVAVTAYAMDGDEDDFLKNGCTHYLAKPFTKNQLFSKLSEVIEEKYNKRKKAGRR